MECIEVELFRWAFLFYLKITDKESTGMPPKRKATPGKTGVGGKKTKSSSDILDTIATLKSADVGQTRKRTPDPNFMEVHGQPSTVSY